MKTIGVDLTANIILQPDVHNKGFVIDSEIAVVSSQNFSPAGVQTNRDARAILEHAGIAKYFEAVFLSDWQKAKPAMVVPSAPTGGKDNKGAGANAPAKRGKTRKAKANVGGWIILRELKTTKDKAELRQNNGGVKVPKERLDELVHDHHLRAILGNLRDTPLVQARFGR